MSAPQFVPLKDVLGRMIVAEGLRALGDEAPALSSDDIHAIGDYVIADHRQKRSDEPKPEHNLPARGDGVIAFLTAINVHPDASIYKAAKVVDDALISRAVRMFTLSADGVPSAFSVSADTGPNLSAFYVSDIVEFQEAIALRTRQDYSPPVLLKADYDSFMSARIGKGVTDTPEQSDAPPRHAGGRPEIPPEPVTFVLGNFLRDEHKGRAWFENRRIGQIVEAVEKHPTYKSATHKKRGTGLRDTINGWLGERGIKIKRRVTYRRTS